MSLEIKEKQVGSVTVLHLRGRLAAGEGSDELSEKLQSLVAAGHSALLLECSQLTGIDSQGISALVRGYVSISKRGGRIKLLKLSPRARYVLEITHLLKVIDAFDDERAALRSF